MNKRTNISFIGIGAQKSGTSWLFANLRKLPQFDLPPKKEIHYFDRNPKYPSSDYLSNEFLINRIASLDYFSKASKDIMLQLKRRRLKNAIFYFKWYFSNYNDEWYLSLFKGYNGFTGEISPSYSVLNEDDIQHMYHLIPDAKLVLMLRNPVKRAWSHYRFNAGKKTDLSADNLDIPQIIEFMKGKPQILKSNYQRTIDNFSKVYPKNQILIGFYDAIVEQPERIIKEVAQYICGDGKISIDHLNFNKAVNKSVSIECPKEVESYLKNEYYPMIKHLAESYGGYFNRWLEDTYEESSSNQNRVLSPTMFLQH